MAESVPFVTFNNGHKAPAVGLGTSFATRHSVRKTVQTAIDLGYRHFDTALLYQNEEEIGSVIAEAIQEGKVSREELFITTKLWCTYNHPKRVLDGLRRSLHNLQLDYVDLFLIHMPTSFPYIDETTWTPRDENGRILYEAVDHAETWKEMEKAVDIGLVKSIGLSAFNCRQVQLVLDHCRIKPANVQIENHAYLMQEDMFRLCSQHGITVTAFCPLGAPDRANKNGNTGLPVLVRDPLVMEMAQRHGKTTSQVLLRFLLQRGRLIIPRSSSPQHLQDNLHIFDFVLTPEEMCQLDELEKHGTVRYYPFEQVSDSVDAPYGAVSPAH